MSATWDILILTQPSRVAFLDQLMPELLRQAQEQPFPTIGIHIRDFDSALSLGENRNRLLARSEATYVSMFDDDDWPAPDFVSRILPLLDGAIDQIGFRVQCYFDGVPFATTIHSLASGAWFERGGVYYRDISHINPMRRDLALASPMEGGFGEDHRWSDRMRALGVVKTERFVGDLGAKDTGKWPLTKADVATAPVMYHYLSRTKKNDARDATRPERLALLQRLRTTRSSDAPVTPALEVPRCQQ